MMTIIRRSICVYPQQARYAATYHPSDIMVSLSRLLSPKDLLYRFDILSNIPFSIFWVRIDSATGIRYKAI